MLMQRKIVSTETDGFKTQKNLSQQMGDVDQGDKEGERELFIKRDTLIQLHIREGGCYS